MTKGSLFLITALIFSLAACGQEQKAENEAEQMQTETTADTLTEKTEDQMAKPMQQDARPLANVTAPERADYYVTQPMMTIDESKKYTATIRTEKGDIVAELNAMYAPLHVNNFVFLAQQGFFDGLSFHRVEPGFVIQGGDPLGAGNGGPGYKIPAEIGLPHNQGALAMARQADQINPERQSSGSQFYITLAPTHQLDGAYSVFGQVISGFEVAQQIRRGDLIIRVDIEEK